MAPDPARVSEFYERKRRLAYHFAWISMALLLVQLSVGSILEFFSAPRPTVTADGGVCLLHRCLSQDEADGSRLLQLGPGMRLRTRPLRLLDSASAALSEPGGLTVFYGADAVLLTDGRNSRPLDLGQKWDVLAAVPDPGRGTAWIAGWNDGKIVVRRRGKDAWEPETAVAPSGIVDRLTLSVDGARGPLVAWRERDSSRIRTALFDGTSFVPAAGFELGTAQHWDVALSSDRLILSLYNRDDRSYDAINLRVECCAGCASPIPQRKIAFGDPVLLIGRKLTGLSTIVIGDRLRYFITRPSRILTGTLPASTLEVDPALPRLHVIPIDPLWRTIVGSVTPTLLIFCSASLVCLGFTLLRERARAATGAALQDEPGAGMMPRLLAYLLDFCLLGPSCYALLNILDLPIEGLDDPRIAWLGLLWIALELAYHVAMEAAFGWTVGKRIVGLRVTTLDGRRPGLRGALVRNLTRLLDGTIPFSGIVGLALILRTPRHQRAGDLIGGTLVVQDYGIGDP